MLPHADKCAIMIVSFHTETILSVFIDFPDPFADIHTPHLRETFYKENFGCVVMHDLLFQLLVYVFSFL